MILLPEMSVDSDRDSVIDSEDGKEVVVRHISFFLQHHFSFLYLLRLLFFLAQENKHLITYIYLFNSSQMRTLIRKRKKATTILRR